MPVVAISQNGHFVLEWKVEKGPVLKPVLLYDLLLDAMIRHCSPTEICGARTNPLLMCGCCVQTHRRRSPKSCKRAISLLQPLCLVAKDQRRAPARFEDLLACRTAERVAVKASRELRRLADLQMAGSLCNAAALRQLVCNSRISWLSTGDFVSLRLSQCD